ncbi:MULTISPECIES: LrgB family protein [Deinococcus]|uniref:LrgB-like protein n=1 Tax=Deinococcus geothermalis (strain DSM 11300 / CIP 105573 / AG-3a) TaxID=319795 RepID=Q1J0A8_DEIGD|nr:MULTISPECIES: LrgB family protein [Deinococcus]ABF45076.1 LrgB-like protein [Deinococcus geothermalis DSM 11300]MBI0445986.1 LrgB family protein [Deinococcus sp. DB0503]
MTWMALTLLAFALGVLAQARVRHPLMNPTLVATVLVAGVLLLTRTSYDRYAAEVRPISFLLGPAVVALAVPLYRLRALLAREWRALVIGGTAGTLVGVGADLLLPRLLGLSAQAQRSLMTAPATSPVALQLAQVTHAPPALAATLAVLSGLLGALVLPPVLTRLGVRHPLARGVALGSVAHGIGTARAREESEHTGAASSIGMGLAALLVTLVVALLG